VKFAVKKSLSIVQEFNFLDPNDFAIQGTGKVKMCSLSLSIKVVKRRISNREPWAINLIIGVV